MNMHCEKWGLNPARLPQHVGIIMDGNGRWATRQHRPRVFGHRKGVERVREIVDFAGRAGIQALSLYAFSDENWGRPKAEIDALMGLLRTYFRNDRSELLRNRVRFRVIGDRQRLPADIIEMIADLEARSADNDGLRLNVALSYGGRGEIVRAARRCLEAVTAGTLAPQELDVETFATFLDTSGMPEVDLLIRTSGEVRVSNFLLWQIAYAEMFFDDTLWPDFSPERFVHVLKEYAGRERRFGKTSAQLVETVLSEPTPERLKA